MGNLFKKSVKEKIVSASPPEESETPEEIKHIEKLSDSEIPEVPERYREIPVCLSQTQINNVVIENNIMLKQIISNMSTD